MSKKVDKVIDYLEKEWGAVPKSMGSVKGHGLPAPIDEGNYGVPMFMVPEELVKEMGKMQLSNSKPATTINGVFDITKIFTATTVPMMEATMLYQPVRGTSSGSRYFILAISPALRVSAKWNINQGAHGLALRVEGKAMGDPNTIALLTKIGLDTKSPHHMSAHLTVENTIEARKAIGALLMAINEKWETPTPDPGVICV